MQVKAVSQNLTELEAECLIVGLRKGSKQLTGMLSDMDRLLEGQISSLLTDGTLTGKRKETLLLYAFGKLGCKAILFIGLGETLGHEDRREVAARAIKTAWKHNFGSVAYLLESFMDDGVAPGQASQSLTEGGMLGAYEFKGFAGRREARGGVESISILCKADHLDEAGQAKQVGEALAIGTNLARDLVNTPGNRLTPSALADAAVTVAQRYGMEVEVLEKEEMQQLGMGGILGVAQGSAQVPKLVAVKYRGRQEREGFLGLVGKGITFDTGGISLKSRDKMEEMIGDMGGAAAVIGALEALGRIKPAVNVLAIIPCAENMPSGTALKPGDVITTMSGRTVEILNTDAEGRLILADGVTYAKKLGADSIVDIATLTGAVLVALGTCTTGMVANNDAFAEEVLGAAAIAGEQAWRLPSFRQYKEQIKSRVADLKNTGGRYAGAITAGLFIGEFAEETPWVHLDIAGTAWSDREGDLSPKGGTGAMVRTLVTLAMGRTQ